MKKVLLCPSERPGVSLLAQSVPLVQVPMLGQGLVEYWLSHLACANVKQVDLLVHDRPELVRALVGNGDRWGLKVQLLSESRELTPAQVLLKYEKEGMPLKNEIEVLDHFPGYPKQNLFDSFGSWFAGVRSWIPHACTPDRVGVRECRPGVWTGLHSLISPDASCHPPCWIGRNVFVEDGAEIGPHAIVEDGSIIESAATIVDSHVGADTFVGQGSEIKESLAWGRTLVNWRTGSNTQVPDAFVLCALRQGHGLKTTGWFERLKELCSREKTEEAELLLKHFLFKKEG